MIPTRAFSALLTGLALFTLAACAPLAYPAPSEAAATEAPQQPPPTAEALPSLTAAPALTALPSPAPAATEAPLEQPPAAETLPSPTAQPAPTAIPGPAPTATAPAASPAILESRRLTLEFPPAMRAGDADLIRLTLEVDELGNLTPTAEIGGHVVTGEKVAIPNLYDTHNVIAEARLDIAGLEVRPSETVSEPLLPGQSVTFYWSVRPQEVGTYRGMVWLHLRFIPRSGGEESRRAISAQVIEIEVATLFGFKGQAARLVGAVGSLLGAVLGLPFLKDAAGWLWRRRRRNR